MVFIFQEITIPLYLRLHSCLVQMKEIGNQAASSFDRRNEIGNGVSPGITEFILFGILIEMTTKQGAIKNFIITPAISESIHAK